MAGDVNLEQLFEQHTGQRMPTGIHSPMNACMHKPECAANLAELDALRKDAERYRWLRDRATVGTVHLQTPDGWAHYRSGADEVVDAAIAAAPAVGAA